jgi:hypothetical protein
VGVAEESFLSTEKEERQNGKSSGTAASARAKPDGFFYE